MLQLQAITKQYPTPGNDETVSVLDNISLDIDQGQSIAIVGPSGSGKSTLLNIIGALDKPTKGSVLLDGKDITQLNEKKLAQIRNRQIGFIFQLHHLLPQCTVLENVLIPTLIDPDKTAREQAKTRGSELLDMVGLGDFKLYRPGQLSGGQKQRVAIARALINKPRILLADEPTGSLDKQRSQKIMEFLLKLNSTEKVTLIMVTHSESIANSAEKVFNLDQGRLQEKK